MNGYWSFFFFFLRYRFLKEVLVEIIMTEDDFCYFGIFALHIGSIVTIGNGKA